MAQLPRVRALRLSETFTDPERLLAVAEQMGLEGIVSKRRDAPYRIWSDKLVAEDKTHTWREANRPRGEMLARSS